MSFRVREAAAREIVKKVDESDLDEGAAEPLVSAIVFTATCYLVYTFFLKVIWRIHEQARGQGHGLALVHLFCFYGDCLCHFSPLLNGSATSRVKS